MKIVIATAILLISFSIAEAIEKKSYIESLQNDSQEQIAMNNFHHEIVTCASFYLIASDGFKNRGDTKSLKLAKRLEKHYTDLIMTAFLLHRSDTTKARFEMAMKTLRNEMHENYTNFSILINKYLYPCNKLIQNPDVRIKYLMEKAKD